MSKKDDKADGISVHSGLPSLSSLEKDAVEMKGEDTGKKLEDADRLDNDGVKEYGKMGVSRFFRKTVDNFQRKPRETNITKSGNAFQKIFIKK